jgi:carbonic anhydrase/acetyltransferase-like protein (isoleucine patch superfamily)
MRPDSPDGTKPMTIGFSGEPNSPAFTVGTLGSFSHFAGIGVLVGAGAALVGSAAFVGSAALVGSGAFVAAGAAVGAGALVGSGAFVGSAALAGAAVGAGVAAGAHEVMNIVAMTITANKIESFFMPFLLFE